MPSTTPPLTVHKSALGRPTPSVGVAISVSDVCEELWSAQDGNQAQPWLQMLHTALLRDRVDAYDPSEAFLCIQGAALNFPLTWECALWAAVALVRVCVGPAWRVQRHELAMMASIGQHPSQRSQNPTQTQSSITATTLSDSTGDESSPRLQQSPRSHSPLSIDPQQVQQPYPWIPEVLPGALLRFAASAPMESRFLAEAQRELVLALCCMSEHPSATFDQTRPEWNIPGAHQPVETMMRFWLESISTSSIVVSLTNNNNKNDNREEEEHEVQAYDAPIPYPQQQEHPQRQRLQVYPIQFPEDESVADLMDRLSRRILDWWGTLLVARACSDLVSAGWRPYQQHITIVLHLLDIAQQGIALRHIWPTATDQESREERLAATSSAAEAIAALASSRELLLLAACPEVVAQLLQLQLAAGKSSRFVHSLYPTATPQSFNDEEEWQQERETFLSQRTSCFSDTAHMLWVLLAHESSTVLVMATLLDHVEDDLECAAVVVRIVSGALWGKPPNVPGISTLRIYWKEFLIVLTKLAKIFVQSAQEIQGEKLTDGVTKLSMTLTLEVVVALGRLMESEMVQGRGILAKDELEEFISILETILIPCLDLQEDLVESLYLPKQERSHNLVKRIKAECENVFLKVGEYLDKCCRFETHQCHLIVYDECRDALHLLLLRKAAPLMADGSSLAIKVFRSWATAGFFPDRREKWVQVARSIVADAFAIFEDHTMSKYGGYVHSPRVRLVALALLSTDEAYATLGKGSQIHHDRRTHVVALSAPLSATRHLFDAHHELISASILPCLSLIFQRALDEDRAGQILQFSSGSSGSIITVPVNVELRKLLSKSSKAESVNHEESFKLRKYSIDLVGRLFCTAAEYRIELIQILEDTAKMQPCQQLRTDASFNDGTENQGEETLSAIDTNRSLLSLEAICQLAFCLSAPFFSITSSHDKLPALIEALCSILYHCGNTHGYNEEHFSVQSLQQEYSFRLLSFAALLPLTRLRRSSDGGLLLVEREEAMSHFPDGVVALFSERQSDFVDDEGPFVAPFARVDICQPPNDSELTFVTLEPIVKTLIAVLQPSRSDSFILSDVTAPRGRGRDLESRFCASCFDAILSYNLSGLSFPTMGIFRSLLSFQPSDGTYAFTENFTRLRAAQAAFQGVVQDGIESDNIFPMDEERGDDISSLVEQLLRLCRSPVPEEVISGCKLLMGLFPSITACRPEEHIEYFGQLYQRILSTLLTSIRDFLSHAQDDNTPEAYFRRKKQQRFHLDRGPPLLLLLYETSLYYLELFDRLESEEAKTLLRLCYDVTSCSHINRACRTLAVRCAVAVLDRQNEQDIDGLMDEYSRNHEGDISTCGVSINSSQLVVPESDIILSALSRKAMNLSNDYDELEVGADEHFTLATEFDNINLFDRTKECAAAWLCGDHLLTCKIGGTKSKNAGWVEIIIRGATFRRRELVRLSSAASVDTPELPSSLWSATSKTGTTNIENTCSFAPAVLQGDTIAMQQALDLLSRCEHLLGPDNRSNFTAAPDHEVSMDSRSRYSSQPEGSSASSPHHAVSDGSLHSAPTVVRQVDTFDPDVPAQIDVLDPSSIRSWLLEVLEDSVQVEDVTKRLSKLGFHTILDSCTTRSDLTKVDPHHVVRLQVDEKAFRAIKLLDRTVALDTHKIALLFAPPLDARNKNDEDEVDCLLEVQSASPSFFNFSRGLGKLVMTRHLKYFSAGFDTSGYDTDGKYALVWIGNKESDAVGSTVLTVFHAVPHMPLNTGTNNRKRHVGNDSVHVVFCDPASFLHEQLWAGGMDEEMESILISGEFGFVTIFIIPVSKLSCRVKVQLKPGLPESTRLQLHYLPGEDIMATNEAPKFVRRLANLADIACSAVMHDKLGPPTSWEIRLRQLRLMRRHEM